MEGKKVTYGLVVVLLVVVMAPAAVASTGQQNYYKDSVLGELLDDRWFEDNNRSVELKSRQPEEDEKTEATMSLQSPSGLNGLEREMIGYVNDERTRAGLNMLQIDTGLSEVARLKSQDMVNNGYFSHNSPTYGSPFEMMKQFGVEYRAAGENIAKHSSVQAAHQALMESEEHRENILNAAYTHIGVGIVTDRPGQVTVTQMFIAR